MNGDFMLKIKSGSTLLLVLFSILISSCIGDLKESDEDLTISIELEANHSGSPIDPENTKVILNSNNSIDWSKGDNILYYSSNYGTVGHHSVEADGKTTTISAKVGASDTFFIATCGGEEIDYFHDESKFLLRGAIKSEQTGLFKDAYISVAKTSDIASPSLVFKCVNSIIKFTLDRTDVSYVVFSADTYIHAYGDVNIQFEGDTPKATSDGCSPVGTRIKVNTNGAGTFYIASLAKSINSFTIDCYDANDISIGHVTGNKPLTLKSNQITNLGTIDSRIKEIDVVVEPLCFSADSEQTISNGISSSELFYSFDKKAWNRWVSSTEILFGVKGKKSIYICGSNPKGIDLHFKFGFDTPVHSSGNIMSLLDYSKEITSTKPYCFSTLFAYNTALVSPPELPATTLSEGCYFRMFEGCTSLETPPTLPARNLSESCYAAMFFDCISLKKAPFLPATNLADYCYYMMFYGCKSLIHAPDLPAHVLSRWCYALMFDGCTAMTTAPALSATSLVDYCYGFMFHNCNKISTITMLATDFQDDNCLDFWLSGAGTDSSANQKKFYVARGMKKVLENSSDVPDIWKAEGVIVEKE